MGEVERAGGVERTARTMAERRPNLCFKRFLGWLFVAGLVIFVNVFFHSVHSVHDARVRASQLEAKVLGALASAFGRGVHPATTSSHPLNGTCTAAWMVKGACFPGGDIRSFPGSDDGSECCAACLAHNTAKQFTFSKPQPPCIGWTLVWTSGAATAHCHLKSKLAGTPESSMRCVSGKVSGSGGGALSSPPMSTARNQEWAEAKAATEHLATAKHHTAAGRHEAAAKHTTAAEHHAVAAEHAAADGQLAAADGLDGLRGEGSSSSSSSFDDRFSHPKAVNRASVVIIQAMPSRRLLLQRRTADYPVKAFAGGLCLFGGNWEEGEPPRETMLRELAEEFNHGEYTQSEVGGAGEREEKGTGKVEGKGKHSQHLKKTTHTGRSATKIAASKKSKTNTSEGGLFWAVRDTATLVGIFDIVVSRTKVLAPDADSTGSAKGGSAEPDYAFIASVFLATVSDAQAEAGLATMTEGSGELVPMPELTRGRSGARGGVRGGGGGGKKKKTKKKKKAGGEKGGEKGTETKMETEEKEETSLRFAWGYGAVVREVLRTNPSLWVGLKLRHFDKQFPALVDPPGVRVSARGGGEG